MMDMDVRRMEMGFRVAAFLAKNNTLFRKNSEGPTLVNQFNYAVAQLRRLTTRHESELTESPAITEHRAAARLALSEAMSQIMQCAKGMAVTMPGVAVKFAWKEDRRASALIGRARAFAENAEPLRRDFLRFEMPATFIEDLKKATDAFEAAVADHAAGRSGRAATTQLTASALQALMDALVQLEPMVRNRLRDNPELLHQWENIRRIERPRARRRVPPEPHPVPQPPDDHPTTVAA